MSGKVICKSTKGIENCPFHGVNLAFVPPIASEEHFEKAYQGIARGDFSAYQAMPEGNTLRYAVWSKSRRIKDLAYQDELARTDDWDEYAFPSPRRKHIIEGNRREEVPEVLTEDDIKALKVYSTNNYKWVNGYLRGDKILPELNEDNETGDSVLLIETESMSKHTLISNPTKTQANEIVTNLDNALTKISKEEPRILYRGLTHSGHSSNKELMESFREEKFQEWSLGSEVSFSSYLSASEDPAAALGYGSKSWAGGKVVLGGVILELKTKKGLNLDGIALYSRENETLIPRNTRWKIVGAYPKIDYITEKGYSRISREVTVFQMVEIED